MKTELMFDFAVNMPRIVISGELMIIDYVKRIVMYSPDRIVVHNGRRYTWVEGKNLVIKELKDERMLITGALEQFGFLETLYTADT